MRSGGLQKEVDMVRLENKKTDTPVGMGMSHDLRPVTFLQGGCSC